MSLFSRLKDWWAAWLILAVLNSMLFPATTFAGGEVIVDSTAYSANLNSHNGTTFTNVFTSDQTGYAFYRDSDGTCAYRKTTNGGTTWGSTVTVDSQTDCTRVAVWYDRWTPNNTTGTKIHIVTIDNGSDDMWYTELNTASDTLSTTLNITGTNQGGTFAEGANLQSVSRGTDGTLYTAINDGGDSFMLRCTSNCTATRTNWTEAGTGTSIFRLGNDWVLLLPLLNNNILTTRWNLNTDNIESRIWSATSSAWDSAWYILDADCRNNGTYDGHFGASVNNISGDIYMAAGCDMQTIGTDDDIRTFRYKYASSSWASTTPVITNTNRANDGVNGITGVKLGLDMNTNNIYVAYSGLATTTITTSGLIYWRVSTNTMQGWGPLKGPMNSTSGDIYGFRLEGNSPERIYATWVIGGILYGSTTADLAPSNYTQTSYRFFANQDSALVGSPYSPQNSTSTILPEPGKPFRLRGLVKVGGDGIDTNGLVLKLQYATTSDANSCDSSFSGETYVDVATSTGDIRFYDNPSVSDGANLTSTSTDPTNGTDTIVNQTYVESNPFKNASAKIFGDQNGKWDFSLYNYAATSTQHYCFRIVENDGTLFDSYNYIPVGKINSKPTVNAPTLNGNQNIVLMPGTYVQVQVTSTASDADGYADLVADGFTGRIFRSGVSSTCATLNENNCYTLNYACSLSDCSGNSCIVTCTSYMYFIADPTDTGTPWEGENWLAEITAQDSRAATSSATATTPVEMLSLLALSVTPLIDYGSFTIGQTLNATKTTIVSSTGNVSLDLTLYGSAMTVPGDSIPVSNQRYSTSSGKTFASSTPLLASPGITLDLNIPKSTSRITPSTYTFWWGVQVPSPAKTGDYTGSNAFIAVRNSLPWP